MTDKTKYSNITVSNETYRELQRLSRDLLPGKTPLSISKTVTVLVNCKIQNLYKIRIFCFGKIVLVNRKIIWI